MNPVPPTRKPFPRSEVSARLHPLMGHFPTIVRLRPMEGAIPPRFAFGEPSDLDNHRVCAASQRKLP